MDELGVGIIGCGWVAEEHIKAYEADTRSRITALVDVNRSAADRHRSKYALDCAVETDYEKVLGRDDVDLVVVCTPNDAHAECVIAAADAGKHILIEKPAAMTPDELAEEREAVRQNGVKTLVSFVLHWNPLLITVDGLLERDQDVFGRVFMLEVDYINRTWMTPEEKWYASAEKSGTALLLSGCHAVDALLWFARSDVEEVFAYQVKTENPLEFPGTISVSVKFKDGKIGRTCTILDAQMPYRFNIGVFGTEGTLCNNRLYSPRMFPGQHDLVTIPCVLPDSRDVSHHPFRDEASHFLDCIVEDKTPCPDLENAARTHLVCFAADISAREGRPVSIGELEA